MLMVLLYVLKNRADPLIHGLYKTPKAVISDTKSRRSQGRAIVDPAHPIDVQLDRDLGDLVANVTH